LIQLKPGLRRLARLKVGIRQQTDGEGFNARPRASAPEFRLASCVRGVSNFLQVPVNFIPIMRWQVGEMRNRNSPRAHCLARRMKLPRVHSQGQVDRRGPARNWDGGWHFGKGAIQLRNPVGRVACDYLMTAEALCVACRVSTTSHVFDVGFRQCRFDSRQESRRKMDCPI